MKKTILFLSLILCVFLGNAQVKNVSINWKSDVNGDFNNESSPSETDLKSKEEISCMSLSNLAIPNPILNFDEIKFPNVLMDTARLNHPCAVDRT